MSDLIDRQAVIDLLKQMRKDGDMVPWEGKDVFARIRKLPTIQPVATDTNVGDTISRQVAIDAVALSAAEWDGMYVQDINGRIRKALEKLPSAQPEPLTDKEQRIFLAAMRREEKVCRQVDGLVRTCHEIIRKVKGTLWT